MLHIVKSWRTLVANEYGKVYCPWCGKRLKTRLSIPRHFYGEHSATGYKYKIKKLPPSTSNRWRNNTRYYIELSGPCKCGCGEILEYPWTGGSMPPVPPPYYKSGHRMQLLRRNRGSWKPGHQPWNTGMKFPNMPRNSGMFKKGNIPKNYKGGITDCNGVVMRLAAGFYPCGVRRRVNVAREVGKKLIGRPLKKNEVAYHKDGDYRNNDPENIMVITRADSINISRPKLLDARRMIPKPVVVSRRRRAVPKPAVISRRPKPIKRQITNNRGQFCNVCHNLVLDEHHICKNEQPRSGPN
jgi:hypothetical protein